MLLKTLFNLVAEERSREASCLTTLGILYRRQKPTQPAQINLDMYLGNIYLNPNSRLNARPITNFLTSDVPAPISYNFASRIIRPAGISFIYPIPPRH
jgi:hypothetical protein